MFLCSSNILPATKREGIQTILNWTGDKLSENSNWLSDETMGGVGSSGTGYNTNRGREFPYFIRLMIAFKSLNAEERKNLMKNALTMSKWLEKIPENDGRQFRHMFLFLLFPDDCERIFGGTDRRKVIHSFTGIAKPKVDKLSALEIDIKLKEIRREQEEIHNTSELDFYVKPMVNQWADIRKLSWLFTWNPKNWEWKDYDNDRLLTHRGKVVRHKWNCSNQNIKKGDIAYLCRTGLSPKGTIATGIVKTKPFEAEHWDPVKAAKGEVIKYVDIDFTLIQNPEKNDPIITVDELKKITVDRQQWSPQSSGIEIKPRSAKKLEKLWDEKTGVAQTKGDRAMSNTGSDLKNSPLNLILYGPPGTGKTYNTVNKALEICGVNTNNLSRTRMKDKFDELVDAGQVVFTTFHQSMTYEDFIEGIKPNLTDDGETVTYKIFEGIFYKLAIEASYSIIEKSKSVSMKKAINFSSGYDQFVENTSEQLARSEEVTLKTKSGGTIVIDSITQHGNLQVKHAVGNDASYGVSKNRLTKLNNALDNITDINNINEKFRAVIGGCNSSAYWAVLNAIRNQKQTFSEKILPDAINFEDKKEAVKTFRKHDYQGVTGRPYVLIIDEINRGNISEIFGELITLIEEDKRLGREEAIEVTLPYSKEKFGVPSNLFIIGTMNTADRSIEALDTALRRRFSFVERLPKPELIQTEGKLKDSEGKIGEIDLTEVLRIINLRIEKLLDQDHTIGHSYFLSVETLEDLKKVFQNKIIPLLQEYFFGDIGKIGLVIGKGFFVNKGEQEKTDRDFFAEFNDYDTSVLMEKNIYHIADVESLSDDDFREAINLLLNKKSGA